MKYLLTNLFVCYLFALSAQDLTINFTKKDVNCFGGSDGEIHLTITGGVKPYTITWYPSTITGLDIFNLPSDLYEVEVTDSVGTEKTQSIYISQPSFMILVSAQIFNTTVAGQNGTATVYPTGDYPPFTYKWNTVPPQTTASISQPPGTYTCTVTDSRGCTATETVTIELISKTTETLPENLVAQLLNTAQRGVFLVQLDELLSGESDLKIVNLAGQPVVQVSQVRNNEQIDLGAQASGMYFVQFSYKGRIRTQKVLLH